MKLRSPRKTRNPNPLPLFEWADQARYRLHRTRPGRLLEHRHGLSPAHAEWIAGTLGMGGCDDR